ncbi:hypothetical protein [Candidatus Uabimicrobium sp. HlEnr_7]|uniref:hypothetical protein n=1 Tax=Candidatus Uabimicrobium helgolandensis TaxID=3095367 RepID=UPI003556DF7C
MRAVIVAPGYSEKMPLLNEYYPISMVPFLGKPFLQHIIESIINLGIQKFDFVLTHLPETIENFFGDGKRWGCEFTFHLVKSVENAYQVLDLVDFSEEETILLAHEAYLPQIQLEDTHVYCINSQDRTAWCGWAWLNAEKMPDIAKLHGFEKIHEHLIDIPHSTITKYLSIISYADLLDSAKKVLNKDFESLLINAKEIEPGIWLSRNVVLPSSTKIKAPAYIGENCRFDQNIHVNGNVVIEEGCIIEEKSTIENAVVFPKSYIGEALDLKNVIVDKNRLINTEFDAEIEIVDDFILGNLNNNVLKKTLLRAFSRALALVLFLFCVPLFLTTILVLKLFRKGPVFFRNSYVLLPTKRDENLWQSCKLTSFCPKESINTLSAQSHFFLLFVPSLWQVAKGKMHFVGVPPRNKDEVKNLPKDWRSLYTSSKCGVITEQYVKSLANTKEDIYASEAFYAVSAGFKQDLRLAIKYLGQVIFFRK